mmetsp:Transcript_26036/g.57641  ORF Transcript_26036/g.57641 Transcript_26036/m.57641 type:complete len:205 (+) Transcript_26036:917-1531(+)
MNSSLSIADISYAQHTDSSVVARHGLHRQPPLLQVLTHFLLQRAVHLPLLLLPLLLLPHCPATVQAAPSDEHEAHHRQHRQHDLLHLLQCLRHVQPVQVQHTLPLRLRGHRAHLVRLPEYLIRRLGCLVADLPMQHIQLFSQNYPLRRAHSQLVQLPAHLHQLLPEVLLVLSRLRNDVLLLLGGQVGPDVAQAAHDVHELRQHL